MAREWTVGFLGFGNMAGAMAKGLLRGGFPAGRLCACAAHFEGLQARCAPLGVLPCETGQHVAEKCDLLIAAVKPQRMEEALAPLRPLLAGKVVLSVASGWDHDRLEALLGPAVHHISAMPNTPVSVGEGVILLEERHSLTGEENTALRKLLAPLGLVLSLPAAQKEIGGILSGCGPAWAAMFIEALGDAGVRYGLPRAAAYRLASQMLAGTGKLQLEEGAHPAAMKDAVCSPGGTTIVGVASLEADGFRSAVIGAVDAVMRRKAQE